MRFLSSHLHSLPFTTTGACVMSARSRYRGHSSWRRGFCDRPGEGDEEIVSGDSHVRTVRDTNYGFWQGDRGGYWGSRGYPPAYFGYRGPPFPTTLYQRPPSNPRPPRPPDYRNWEYATSQPSSHCERFVVLSYNILADYLARDHRHRLYFHIPPYILDWEWRKRRIIIELGLWAPDIMCFQEVDRFQDLEKELYLKGYTGIWKMRTGTPIDGCAIFWRTSRFNLLHQEDLEFAKHGLRDNIVQICVLESRSQTSARSGSAIHPSSCPNSGGSNKVVVCNTHVLYNPNRGDIKVGQVRLLLERAHAVSRTWNDAPVIICGDFNCTPKSPLYNFISEQKLSLSGLAKNEISGQFSACIHHPRPIESDLGMQSPYVHLNGSDMTASVNENICTTEMNSQHKSHYEASLGDDSWHSQLKSEGLFDEASEASCSDGRDFLLQNYTRTASNETCDLSEKLVHLTLSGSAQEEMLSGASALHIPENKVTSANEVGGDREVGDFVIEGFTFGGYNATTGSLEEASGHDAKVSPTCRMSSEDLCPCSEAAEFSVALKVENPQLESGSGASCNADAPTLHTVTVIDSPNSKEFLCLKESISKDEDEIMQHKEIELQMSDEAKVIFEESSMPADSDTNDVENRMKDPSFWTQEEIAAASGDALSTHVEHSLKLRSAYTEIEDVAGTRDSNREPQVTSYNRRFMGTVDYIWYSEGLQTVKVLDTIPKHVLQRTPGFPTKKWGSDHLALVCQLAFRPDSPSDDA